MFTIKHVLPRKTLSGMDAESVALWEGSNVRSDLNRHTSDTGEEYENYTVYFDQPDGSICSIDSGTIYVMNSSGKTVETFRL